MSGAPVSQTAPNGIESRTELARRFVESLVDGTAMGDRRTFDHTALQGLKVVEVGEGRIVCEMPVSERVQNRYRTLHGGATATLVDTISTAALLTTCPHSGVSVHLAITYLAPMPGTGHTALAGPGGGGGGVGEAAVEAVVIEARVTRVGRQLASLEAQLRRKSTGQLIATGTHTKFLAVADPAMDKMRRVTSSRTRTAVAAAGEGMREGMEEGGQDCGGVQVRQASVGKGGQKEDGEEWTRDDGKRPTGHSAGGDGQQPRSRL